MQQNSLLRSHHFLNTKSNLNDNKCYKSLKIFVGISSTGVFAFVSKLWFGSTSDHKIVQESGPIDLPEEGGHPVAGRFQH